jgi:hypothetical protein
MVEILASLAIILTAICTGGRWLFQRIRNAIQARRDRRRKVDELQAEVADLKRQLRQRPTGSKRSAQVRGRHNGQLGSQRGAPFVVAPANGMVTIRSARKSSDAVLSCTLMQWRDFLDRVKKGEFDDLR